MVARLIVVAGLVGALAWGVWLALPPGVVAARGAGDFSVDNALAHVRAMAAEGPRPAESAANGRVREYLLEELRKLGMEARVLTGAAMGMREAREVTARNIVARLPGTEGGPAVMLAAHYDSVPFGPGAADDGAAVGALLEACRAIKAGPQLKRDVLLVLTDGEEGGLVGARALFARDAKLFREAVGGADVRSAVGVVMNFEARGTGGPSLMFETGPGNAGVIRAFAKGAAWPYANSLSYDVYRMLPNDTDFSVFKRPRERGGGELQGLNFAFIANDFWYHTRFDTPENLRAESVHHHGANALAMARHFGGMGAEELRKIRGSGDAVYFNVSRGTLVSYPGAWVWPLVGVQGVLALGAVVVGLRRGVMTWRGLLGGMLRFVVALVVVPAAVYGLTLMVKRPQTPGAFAWQLAGVIAVGAVITVAVALTPARFWRRESGGVRGRRVAGFAGALGVVLVGVSFACALYVPGGSFLIVWPAILVALGLLIAALRVRVDDAQDEAGEVAPRRSAPTWTGILSAVVFVPAVVLWAPLLVQLFTALRMPMAWACSALVVVAVAMVVAGLTPLAIGAGGGGVHAAGDRGRRDGRPTRGQA